MKIALDAQLILRTQARRMFFAAAEIAHCAIVLPATATEMAQLHYARVSRGTVTRRTEWELKRDRYRFDQETLSGIIAERLTKAEAGFRTWLATEPQRNRPLFTIGERSKSTAALAEELWLAGVVSDRKDQRWDVGEDPFVLAEALEAGAHWIASANFSTLEPDVMEQWLEEVQAKGRFPHVPRPFILRPESALDTLIHRAQAAHARPALDTEVRLALGHAVSHPGRKGVSTAEHVAALTRLVDQLGAGGLHKCARILSAWATDAAADLHQGNEAQLWTQIKNLEEIVAPDQIRETRACEERRTDLETHGALEPQRKRRPPRTHGRQG